MYVRYVVRCDLCDTEGPTTPLAATALESVANAGWVNLWPNPHLAQNPQHVCPACQAPSRETGEQA
jgi:hypothetical protein